MDTAFAAFILGRFRSDQPGFVAWRLKTYNFNEVHQSRTKI